MIPTIEDRHGNPWTVPEIDYPIARRLKDTGVCDLMAVVSRPDEYTKLYERFNDENGTEFTIDFAYVVFNESVGNQKHQTDFASLWWGGDKGSAPFFALKNALIESVVGFFQPDIRESIRQLNSLKQTQQMTEVLSNLLPGLDFTVDQSDSGTPGTGSNGCWELFSLTDPGSLCEDA